MLIPDIQLIRKHSYLNTWYHAVLSLTSLRLRTCGCMPGGGARGQNLEHLFFHFFFLVWNYSYLNHLNLIKRHYIGLTFSLRLLIIGFNAPGLGGGGWGGVKI